MKLPAKIYLIISIILSSIVSSCHSQSDTKALQNSMKEVPMEKFNIEKTDEQWREELGQERFGILRLKGTEKPFTGELLNQNEDGTYSCAGCGTALFKSDMKFDSKCGWPSFDNEIEGKVLKSRDTSHGMIRTEIICANCGGHLGHIFDDGPTETGLRYCVNSLSLKFNSEK